MAADLQQGLQLNVSVETSTPLKGTCMKMCPDHERILRERQRRLHPFEILQDSHCNERKPKADIGCIVKEFSRPAAGRELQPDELRPASVLVKTMDFLLRDVMEKSSPWAVKCNYVSDRVRAIRQDLTAEGIIGQEAIDILEKATRYYIVTAVKLRRETLENFEPVLHNTHTQECMKKLLCLYELGSSEPKSYSNRPSFEACYLLLNLGSAQAYHRGCCLPERVRKSKVVRLAFGITSAYLHGNYVSVFRKLMQLPFLESCAFHRHIEPIVCQALEVMSTAYSSKNLSYPLSSLTKIFCFDTEDIAVAFCNACGVSVMAEKVVFVKGKFVQPEKNDSMLLSCDKMIMSKLKGDLTAVLLFHEQCGWDEKTTNVSEQQLGSKESMFEHQEVPTCAAACESTAMVGAQQKEVVPEKKGYRWSTGRGRARRNVYQNVS